MSIAMLFVFVLVLGVALAVYGLAISLTQSDDAPVDEHQQLVRGSTKCCEGCAAPNAMQNPRS